MPSDTGLILHGAPWSVYVRIVRLVLAAKGLACRVDPVDAFAPGGPPAEHLSRQPFGRIPALSHGAVVLYETAAITRYLDEAFPGPALQPDTPLARARMAQAIGLADSYVYPCLVWQIYVPRSRPAPDLAVIAAATPRAETCLDALCALIGPGFGAARPGLADFHLLPMIDYFLKTPEGRRMLPARPALAQWWARMAGLPGVAEILSDAG
ncbi:glutathione S-transferase family protein [Paroceanicella profunda]|uniref:Glutathione S-transferase family protein n=1 Tax=Paroceanicella profunda TaxID=2579971 RepID=A0A5B8FPV8_9RHOB|nr:glutathione S-transferase family protein [Paroceanicella profunda]QDL90325.1 glutathione S-transferase family protein [Paroceanicella profunda]